MLIIKKSFVALLRSVILFLLIPFVSTAQSPSLHKIILQNKLVRLEFDSLYGGLVSMVDLSSGVEHIHKDTGKYGLWNLNFSRGIDKRALSGTDIAYSQAAITKLPDGGERASFEWLHLEWPLEKINPKKGVILGTVAVKVTVDLPANSGIALWRIWVDNNSDIWGLNDIDFPSLHGFLESGQYDVAKPYRPGILYKACAEKIYGDYRGNDMPMQFLCAIKDSNAVYMAAHDTLGWWKNFTLEPGKTFSIKTYAEDMGVAGSDYKNAYPVMIGVYHGNWMEGCKIYRRFAQSAPWLAKGKISQRSDMPQQMKNMGLWFEVGATLKWPDPKPGGENSPLFMEHEKMQQYFDVPLGSHWIVWTQIGYDEFYPHFFPEKEGVSETTKRLVAKGFTIMPHINGRLADTFNDDYALYDPYTAKDPMGKPYIELLGPLRGRMAVMCPYTAFWQDKIAAVTGQIGSRLGANGVYLDQVCASSPALCYDKSHGHPLGGGHWWVDGYKAFLTKVRAAAHSNGNNMMIGSEQTLEQYIGLVDGFFEMPYDGKGIPMLEAVYSGYALYYGSAINLPNNTDRGWKMMNGRSFIWGKQNGWVNFDILKPEYATRAEYFKKIGKYRVATRKFLTYGELVSTFNHPETITETWRIKALSGIATLPVIQGTIWKAEDGTLGIFLVNYLEEQKSIALSIDPAQYGLVSPSGKYTIRQINPDGTTGKPVQLKGSLQRVETLEASGIKVYEISLKK